MALTMQQTELQNLALDCELSNAKFSMTRVINIFERADQVDDTFEVSKADRRVVKGETAKGGDNGLELHEFFECLVMLGLHKANPKFGEVGHNDSVEFPLPGCLDTLLNKSILKKAKGDNLAKILKRIQKEPEVQAVVRARAPALEKQFKGKSSAAYSKTANPLMTMEQFVAMMVDRSVAKDVIVHPEPNISGAFVPDVHSNLSQLDIKGAFVTAQQGDSNRDQIDASEFVHIIGLCGYIKYEEVEAMSLAQRVEGAFANFLGERDEKAVITAALYPPLERFDPAGSTADPKLLETWAKMDLSHSAHAARERATLSLCLPCHWWRCGSLDVDWTPPPTFLLPPPPLPYARSVWVPRLGGGAVWHFPRGLRRTRVDLRLLRQERHCRLGLGGCGYDDAVDGAH